MSFNLDDPNAIVAQLRRNALWCLAGLAVGVAVVTGSVWQVVGVLLSGLLVLANFQGLASVVNALVDLTDQGPGGFQIAFMAGRFVLLAILLCGIVLLPGVGPIPVALGLSVLILALLLEAIKQLFSS